MKKQTLHLSLLAFALLSTLPLASCNHNAPSSSAQTSSGAPSSGTTSSTAVSSSTAGYLHFGDASLSLKQFDAVQLKVETNITSALSWTSSDTSVASVSQSGRLFAKKAGSATISVASGGVSATLSLAISSLPEVSKDYIKVSSSLALALDKQATQTLAPSYIQVSGTTETEIPGKTFVYSSLDESVAAVSSAGVVTALKSGSTSISITCGDAVSYLDVEVYEKGLATTDDWLKMIQDYGHEVRYCLLNDIDFTGVSYVGYMDLSAIPDSRWTAELNGLGHHIQNVTMGTTADGNESLFGQIMGGTIEDIAFDNVVFNGSGHNSGLAGYIFKHNNAGVVCPTYLRNIALDCHYATSIGTGFVYDFYGGEVENVFIHMRTSDGSAFKGASYGVCNYTTFWYGGSYKNVIAYTENGALDAIGREETATKVIQTNVVSSSHKMDCITAAYSSFDSTYWTLTSDSLPTLK
jgi:hypothetical protein